MGNPIILILMPPWPGALSWESQFMRGCDGLSNKTNTIKSPKMKKKLILVALLTMLLFSGDLYAQTGKSDTISIKTSVVCGMCRERVEQNLAFEKGIRDVEVNLETKDRQVCRKLQQQGPMA
jgi:hypothetical protein